MPRDPDSGGDASRACLAQDDTLLAFAQNQRGEVRDMRDLSGALAARPGAKQQTYVCRPGTHCLHNCGFGSDVSGRVRASGVNHPKAVAFLPNAGGRARSMALGEELSPTLKTDHNPAVACLPGPGSRPATLQVRGGKEGGGKGARMQDDMSATLTVAQTQTLFPGDGTVRRLTPTECERLQGFEDGWTDVPYRGAEHAPDSPRYKALGNSMAVPVMRWIGQRIQEAEGGVKDGS